MGRATMKVTFNGNSGGKRTFAKAVEIPWHSTPAGQKILADLAFAEFQQECLREEISKRLPDPSIFMRDLDREAHESYVVPDGVDDLIMAQWVWFELHNTCLQARHLLAKAMAYKTLEPPKEGDATLNTGLYLLHLRKMQSFHLAVLLLRKVEDLILHLIFAIIGPAAIRVDASAEDWERDLTLRKLAERLKKSRAELVPGRMTEAWYFTILDILSAIRSPDRVQELIKYRDRFTHRSEPAVDYPELYAHLERRRCRRLEDDEYGRKTKVWTMGGLRAEYTFTELYTVAVFTFEHYAGILTRLRELWGFVIGVVS